MKMRAYNGSRWFAVVGLAGFAFSAGCGSGSDSGGGTSAGTAGRLGAAAGSPPSAGTANLGGGEVGVSGSGSGGDDVGGSSPSGGSSGELETGGADAGVGGMIAAGGSDDSSAGAGSSGIGGNVAGGTGGRAGSGGSVAGGGTGGRAGSGGTGGRAGNGGTGGSVAGGGTGGSIAGGGGTGGSVAGGGGTGGSAAGGGTGGGSIAGGGGAGGNAGSAGSNCNSPVVGSGQVVGAYQFNDATSINSWGVLNDTDRPVATQTFDPAVGRACAGSLRLAIAFSSYVDTKNGTQANFVDDWTGKTKLHIAIKFDDPGGHNLSFLNAAQLWVQSNGYSIYHDHWYGDLTPFEDFEWHDLVLDLTTAPAVQLSDVHSIGIQFFVRSTKPEDGPDAPLTTVVHLDDVWLE